jgi:hypothetical protein
MSKRFLRQADNCHGRGPLNPFLVRLMCGRISSNGKSRKRPAGVLEGNFFVKTGVFYKKKPLRPAAGAQLGKKLIRPPEEFLSKPYGMRKHCFPLLPANCRQAGLLTRANDVNPHGGVIDLAGSVVFIFGPNLIKVYYTNRGGANWASGFLQKADKTVWMRGRPGGRNSGTEGAGIPKLRLGLSSVVFFISFSWK